MQKAKHACMDWHLMKHCFIPICTEEFRVNSERNVCLNVCHLEIPLVYIKSPTLSLYMSMFVQSWSEGRKGTLCLKLIYIPAAYIVRERTHTHTRVTTCVHGYKNLAMVTVQKKSIGLLLSVCKPDVCNSLLLHWNINLIIYLRLWSVWYGTFIKISNAIL